MSLNANIIDQHVRALAEQHSAAFDEKLNIKNDEIKQRSTAFVLLVVKRVLELEDEEALECLTEGGNDFGIDAMHVGAVQDEEFTVTLFQGKYKQNLDGVSSYPENGVTKVIQAVGAIFDPDKRLTLNDALKPRVEEIRSLIRDGYLPQVRVILCNNGPKWNAIGQQLIDQAGFGDQVEWEHVSHDTLIGLLQATKPVNDSIVLTGEAMIENFDYRRALIAKMPVAEIAALFNRHGDKLLERNIRRYLGMSGNRVNENICRTLKDANERSNFYFYNNGVTFICTKFAHNQLQAKNWQVKVEGLQVINGGQTCKTIQTTLAEMAGGLENLGAATVLMRLYELPGEEHDLVRNITYATNSQNPVDLRDLHSNDARQRQLEASIQELGFVYRRHRGDPTSRSEEITTATAAEAVLSVWREKPQQAKFFSREHFGKLYDTIFTADLNGAQLVTAVLLFRFAENKRKRPPENAPEFLPYASCFVAMLMGRYLLAELGVTLTQLNHLNFQKARATIEAKADEFYQRAIEEIRGALLRLYGNANVSLQRLSATFRRGDLIEELNPEEPEELAE